ncbi:hypothetical protein JCM3765_000755 [Sporobolomyces pararoseus]
MFLVKRATATKRTEPPPLEQYQFETLIYQVSSTTPHENKTTSSDPTSSSSSSQQRPLSPNSSSNNNARSVSTNSSRGGGGRVIQDVQVVGNDELWLLTNQPDSQVKIYGSSKQVQEQEEEEVDLMDLSSPSPSSPSSSSPQIPTTKQEQQQALELLNQFKPPPTTTTTTKAVVKISKFEILNLLSNKALILTCDGVLSFHNLKPSLSPLSKNLNQFPSIKGVITFSLDAQEQSQSQSQSQRSSSSSQQLVVIKRKSIHWFKISNDLGIESLKSLPLPPPPDDDEFGGRGGGDGDGDNSGLIQSCKLSNKKVCIADQMNYSLVDLERAEAFPLLPISQAPPPPPDPEESQPPPTTSITTESRQPPLINCVGFEKEEFLITSHTGSTSLGVFINNQGEPCRGTIEWSESNLISLVVTTEGERGGEFGIGLMWNQTLEIHDLINQEFKQRIQLTSLSLGGGGGPIYRLKRVVVSTSSSGGDGFEFQPRGGVRGRDQMKRINIPLSLPNKRVVPPSTPIRNSSITLTTRGGEGTIIKSSSKVLLIGNDSIFALVKPNWFLLQEELLNKGKIEECENNLEIHDDNLNRRKRKRKGGGVGGGEQEQEEVEEYYSIESNYLHLKLGFLRLIKELDFEKSFKHFLASQCDPRIVIKLFINQGDDEEEEEEEDVLNSTIKELIRDDQVESFKGIQEFIKTEKDLNHYILDNLNHNYSPHLSPSVETSPSTISLRSTLISKALSSFTSYLMKWRISRRGGGGQHHRSKSSKTGRRSQDCRKIDMLVDTSLVCLLAKENRPMDIKILLASSNDCVFDENLEFKLLKLGLVGLVIELELSKNRFEKVLKIWLKVFKGEYQFKDQDQDQEDNDNGGDRDSLLKQIFELLWKLRLKKDYKGLVETYGLWLLKQDRELGLKLFNDPKQHDTLSFDTRELFTKMKEVDEEAADLFLENSVLQEKDTDSSLHVDLVKRYLGKLKELIDSDSDAKAHLREQETVYSQNSTSSSSTFLSFLIEQYSPTCRFSTLDRIRLKTILLLTISNKYDLNDSKTRLEEIEIKNGGGGCLTFERVIVYGKLKLDRQALSLLLNHLKDFKTSETYTFQSGDPIVSIIQLKEILTKLNLSPLKRLNHFKKIHHHHGQHSVERKKDLAKILVEMTLLGSTSSTTKREKIVDEQGGKREEAEEDQTSEELERISKILEAQAINLDTIEVLPLIPDTFPIDFLNRFLSRSIRRSLHTHQESSILKNLASGQNLKVSEKLFTIQEKFGPSLELPKQQRGGGGGGFEEKEKIVVQVEKGDEEGENEEDLRGEKEIKVLPQPEPGISLEDAVELDLR